MENQNLDVYCCQSCHSNLFNDNKNYLVCENCGLKFPIYKNLIFMGTKNREIDNIIKMNQYEAKYQVFFQSTMFDFDYQLQEAKRSFQVAILLAKYIQKQFQNNNSVKVLDLGCGAGYFGYFLAELGFDVYFCESEPNILFSGKYIYKGSNNEIGKHLICDVNYLPYKEDSFDLVIGKEILHHIDNKNSIFRQINVILKKNGLFLIFEPTNGFYSWLKKKKNPDNCPYHFITSYTKYNKEARRNGFEIYDYSVHIGKASKRILQKIRNIFNKQFDNSIFKKRNYLKKLVLLLIGGSYLGVYSKKRNLHYNNKIDISLIPIRSLVIDEKEEMLTLSNILPIRNLYKEFKGKIKL